MQTWRQKAIAAWPEFYQAIQEAETPSEFWLTLREAFLAISYGTRDAVALRCFYAYAWWSLEGSEDEDTARAAVLNFYERLPEDERVRQKMHLNLTIEQFERIKELWHYGRSEEEYKALLVDLQHFREGKHLSEKILPKYAFKGISSRRKR